MKSLHPRPCSRKISQLFRLPPSPTEEKLNFVQKYCLYWLEPSNTSGKMQWGIECSNPAKCDTVLQGGSFQDISWRGELAGSQFTFLSKLMRWNVERSNENNSILRKGTIRVGYFERWTAFFCLWHFIMHPKSSTAGQVCFSTQMN